MNLVAANTMSAQKSWWLSAVKRILVDMEGIEPGFRNLSSDSS
jgi:hypothetical protein